jgi:hypothetical protein
VKEAPYAALAAKLTVVSDIEGATYSLLHKPAKWEATAEKKPVDFKATDSFSYKFQICFTMPDQPTLDTVPQL